MTERNALILEDDVWVAPIIELALKKAAPDIQVDKVDSVEEAVNKTKLKNYEIIVADIFVRGDKTGMNFWQHCKKACPDSKVLLTSSLEIEEFEDRFTTKRSTPLYIRKPLNVGELTRTVEAMLDFTGLSS